MSWEDSRYPQPQGYGHSSGREGPYMDGEMDSPYDQVPRSNAYGGSGYPRHDDAADYAAPPSSYPPAPGGYSSPAAAGPKGNMTFSQEKYEDEGSSSWWNPKTWGKKGWAIAVAILAILLIVIIVPAVVVTKENAYPDYSQLTYKLSKEYTPANFFDQFQFFTGYDPAQGFVHYVPKEQAESLNLTYASSNSAFVKVDTSVGPSSSPDASTGRFSVRLESQDQYDKGLFIFDVKHTPYGCGTWPALWLSDPVSDHWPQNGEIDIMEAVNQGNTGNQMTLHTSGGCSMGGVKRKMTGSSLQGDCHNTTNGNAGCGVEGANVASYGADYNDASGGITAVEWRSEGIRMWQFGRGSDTPSDITSGNPDPSTWGMASADFPNTSCDIDSHFRNQSIIVNIDLCGQYAGSTYEQDGCPGTCTDYVANQPAAFQKAYWEFGGFKVYQAE